MKVFAATIGVLGCLAGIAAELLLGGSLHHLMDEQGFLQLANTCIRTVNQAVAAHRVTTSGAPLTREFISTTSQLEAKLLGTMNVLESLALFIKDPARKSAYLDMLASGDFSQLSNHLFYLYTGFLGPLEYDFMSTQQVLVPAFNFGQQYQRLLARMTHLDDSLTRYLQLPLSTGQATRVEIKSVWDISQALGVLAVTTSGPARYQPFSYEPVTDAFFIGDLPSAPVAGVIPLVNELVSNNPVSDIGSIVYASSSYHPFFEWMETVEREGRVSQLPWMYFDKQVFLNVPVAIDQLVLATLVRRYQPIGLGGVLRGVVNPVLVVQQGYSVDRLFQLYTDCLWEISSEGEQTLILLLKSHVYDIVMAYLAGALDQELLSLELAKACRSFQEIHRAIVKSKTASTPWLLMHPGRGGPPAERQTDYSALIARCLGYLPTLVHGPWWTAKRLLVVPASSG